MTVQPRVMQVLLALVDATGRVVTRDDLMELCWNGRFVADDSLNGAIAELRKALRTVSAEVSIETVSKAGYRLVSPQAAETSFDSRPPLDSEQDAQAKRLIGRRLVVSGGLLTAVAATSGTWFLVRKERSGDARLMIDRGMLALRQGLPGSGLLAAKALTEAVRLDPDNAKAWGLLALAWRATAEYAEPDRVSKARADSEIAAKRALALDGGESHALTALATLPPMFGDWIEAERRIRSVLAIDPENRFTVAALATLLMSTGQVSACLERLEWLVRNDPLSADSQFRRVYTLWSAGALAEMDRAADWALQSWPDHPAVWFARFWTLAFTGRAAAAQGMLADAAARPPMPPPALRVLTLSMRALISSRPENVRAAVNANLAAAPRGPSPATTALMVLSQLGEAEAAFGVAKAFFLRQGSVVVQTRHTRAQPSVTDQHQKFAMQLWIPATEPMRMNPGFRSLCDGIGLLDYWKATGARPDFRKGSLAVI